MWSLCEYCCDGSRLTYRRVKCEQEAYKAYEQHFKDSPPAVLRDCLELVSGLGPISIDEVPPLPLHWGRHLLCRMPPNQLPTQNNQRTMLLVKFQLHLSWEHIEVGQTPSQVHFHHKSGGVAGGAGSGHHEPLLHGRHVPGRHLARDARDHRHRHEPHRRCAHTHYCCFWTHATASALPACGPSLHALHAALLSLPFRRRWQAASGRHAVLGIASAAHWFQLRSQAS